MSKSDFLQANGDSIGNVYVEVEKIPPRVKSACCWRNTQAWNVVTPASEVGLKSEMCSFCDAQFRKGGPEDLVIHCV